jgi:hypothetical protein
VIENEAESLVSVSVDLRDVEYVLGVDTNGDASITWGELSSQQVVLAAYVAERVTLARGDTACSLSLTDLRVDDMNEGVYAVLQGTLHVHTLARSRCAPIFCSTRTQDIVP